mgnify:CR=1 FL=1
MEEFFASLYEWFGLNPLYSTDMGDQLRGWDISSSGLKGRCLSWRNKFEHVEIVKF